MRRILTIVSLVILISPVLLQGAQLPPSLSDQEFWRMISDLSERGGVYIGVGPEQNFTYIAAIQPRIAFVVDIRRDNMLEHLMYKALFELSKDRADFVSRLFSRKRPQGLDAKSSIRSIFDPYQSIESDPQLYQESLTA